jgi:hypothetical protein
MVQEKMKRRKTTTWLIFVLAFLFLGNIYDAGGTLGVKYVSTFIAMVAIVATLRRFDLSAEAMFVGAGLFIVWPTWSFVYGLANGADPGIALNQVSSFLFAGILAGLISSMDNRLPLRMLYWCMFSLAVVILVLFAILLAAPQSGLSGMIMDFLARFHEKQGYFGSNEDKGLIIYFRAALFLVPTCVYFFFTGRTWRALLVLLAVAMSQSKSGVVISLGFAVGFLFFAFRSKRDKATTVDPSAGVFAMRRKTLLVLGLGLVGVIFLSVVPKFSKDVWEAMTVQSETALLRKGHIQSVIDLLDRRPDYLLTGQGAGTHFYSVGAQGVVDTIEVDHLNAIRKFGLPWFIVFTAVVIRVVLKLIRSDRTDTRASGFALASSFLASGTNPVLITPLFMMLLVASYFAQRQEPAYVG